ncbi:MAG: IS4 family transposase [Verrucomicrobia bacterium]|nr:IS4 family transposase [Verrucomicrobiota bacterium]
MSARRAGRECYGVCASWQWYIAQSAALNSGTPVTTRCVFEEAEWKSACAVVKRSKEAGEPTLSEFIAIVGKLGGHLGRKSDGAPGPQSIWQGLARVRDFACAWHAFHEK